ESGDAAALQIAGMSVAYDVVPVVWNASFEVQRGRLMAIVGPNGAGKSTLLKAALGMLPRLAGRVRAFGVDPADDRSRIAYVPQRTSVDWDFPATVLDVVLMGTYGRLGWCRRPRKADRQAALEALKMVEMDAFQTRQIAELSGGQQQRVFLARALVQDAELYLMDEPFAGVDAVTERAIVALLKHLRDEGRTILVVHHDLATVPDYFDDVTLLDRRVIASGPVESVFTRARVEETYGGRVRASLPELALEKADEASDVDSGHGAS
ncbi:MAG: metal ABC transporter ATP-binding protein, partial [Planctomycetota bacterium]